MKESMSATRIMEKNSPVVREPGAQKTANEHTHSEMGKKDTFLKCGTNMKVIKRS